MWLKKFDYNPDDYIDKLILTNDISVLPKEVQEKFTINDCYIYVDITQDLIDKWTTDVINTIDEIIEKEEQYKSDYNEEIFFDTDENVKAQSYYFANLSGYSANLHKPYKKYLEQYEREKNGDLLGVLPSSKKVQDTDSDDDLSWLDMI